MMSVTEGCTAAGKGLPCHLPEMAVRPCRAVADEPLAPYAVTYQPDTRQRRTVTKAHRSPQLPLWALGAGEWLQVLRVLWHAQRKRRRDMSTNPLSSRLILSAMCPIPA